MEGENANLDLIINVDTAIDNESEESQLIQQYLRLRQTAILVVCAATSSLMHLHVAAMTLHKSKVGNYSKDRSATRNVVLHTIIQSDSHCRDLIRMGSESFALLYAKIKQCSSFKQYARGSIEEQLVTFMLIIGHSFKNRVVGCFLCRSGKTISRYFHNILDAIIEVASEYVKQPSGARLQTVFANNERFYSYFQDCLGAIDGTHVRVKVSEIDAQSYRGRKDWPTQNVLAACTFDMMFAYILAGWEGSASDSRVLKSALTREDPLIIPDGKFYLGDSGFGLSSQVLTPYGRTRYHLKEYSQRGTETPEELFNHRHTSLRNCIECAFGVLKKRFSIISSGAECQYNCGIMSKIVLSCCALHNFSLRDATHEIDLATKETANDNDEAPSLGERRPHRLSEHAGIEYNRGALIRDKIAAQMWDDYVSNYGVCDSRIM